MTRSCLRLRANSEILAYPKIPMNSRSHKAVRLAAGSVLVAGTTGVGALISEQAGAVEANSLSPQSTFAVSNTNDAGAGSLRQAVLDANANAGADTITFDPSVTGTITLTSGEIGITDSVTITGPGSAILAVSGSDVSRVLNVSGTADVELVGITLTQGRVSGAGTKGGALKFDQIGDMTVVDVTITDSSSAESWGGGLFGCNTGDVTIADSQFIGNTASGGGGISLYCNAPGQVTISSSTISGNSVGLPNRTDLIWRNGSGGGIWFAGAKKFTMLDTTIADNSATAVVANPLNTQYGHGAGAYIYALNGLPTTLTNVTVSGNTMTNGLTAGAEIWSNATVTVANSTFTENVEIAARPATSRGALSLSTWPSASMLVAQTTISGNSTNGVLSGLSTFAAAPATIALDLYGSVVAGNSGGSDLGDQNLDTIGNPSDANVSFALKHAVVGTVAPSTNLSENGGNQMDVADPLLAPLANNGGPTRTMALLPGSPLLDAGGTTVPTFPGNVYDQRGAGFARLVGSALDVGAFEVQAPTLTGVAPATGSAAGGTTITMTGTNFVSGMTVTVGGVACSDVTVLSSTSATCVTPGGNAGAADVAVHVSGLTATLQASYTYVADASGEVVPAFTG
jgi:hypothetical protein